MTTTQKNKSQPFSFRLNPTIKENLNYYAGIFRRNKSSIIEEALENYFAEQEQQKKAVIQLKETLETQNNKTQEADLKAWQIEEVKKAKAEIKAGKVLDGETVMKWFKSLNTNDPLPRPSHAQTETK